MTVNNPAVANDWQRERTELISRMRLDAYRAFRERPSVEVINGWEFLRLMRVEESKFPLGWDERWSKI